MRIPDRYVGKILVALILISGSAAILFGRDLYRTLRAHPSQPPPLHTTETQSEADGLSKLKDKSHYDLIAKRNIFVFPADAMAKDAPPPPAPQNEAKKLPPLNVKLRGTIFSPNGFAVAMIEDRAKRKENLFVVGDRIEDAEIIGIQREQVVLKRAGGEETLAMFEEDKDRRPRGSPQPRTPTPDPGGRSPPRQVSDPESGASSREIQQKIRSLMAQLRLTPHFEKGKPGGFKVGQVAEGSVFQAAGLKQGDIVVAINDIDVQTPNQLLKAYREAAEDEELSLDIIRGGQEDTIDVDLEGIIPSD